MSHLIGERGVQGVLGGVAQYLVKKRFGINKNVWWKEKPESTPPMWSNNNPGGNFLIMVYWYTSIAIAIIILLINYRKIIYIKLNVNVVDL